MPSLQKSTDFETHLSFVIGKPSLIQPARSDRPSNANSFSRAGPHDAIRQRRARACRCDNRDLPALSRRRKFQRKAYLSTSWPRDWLSLGNLRDQLGGCHSLEESVEFDRMGLIGCVKLEHERRATPECQFALQSKNHIASWSQQCLLPHSVSKPFKS